MTMIELLDCYPLKFSSFFSLKMSVQAQHHSSNLLFLNNRKGKEKEDDFSLRQQAGDFLHQSNMLFNNEGNNQQLPLQFQLPQVIDLSLLHSEELDGFLRAQAEELRRKLAEKRKMHYKALLGAIEEPLLRKLREKEAELETATRRHNELEARDLQLKLEAQAWQERARAQEAVAASLKAQLHQVVNEFRGGGGVSVQDSRAAEEELLRAAGISGLEDAESAYVDPERVRRPRCKACRRREATVVVLPCRHLSICPECDRTALACPLCLTLRNSSVEAILC